jgi:hypothetical protein
MNRAKLDQRLARATLEVDRTRNEYQDAAPADKERTWDRYQRAVNSLNAAIEAAAKHPVHAPSVFDREEV